MLCMALQLYTIRLPRYFYVKIMISNLRLNPMTITKACESGFGAVGSWLGYCEAGEIEASAGRG